MVLIHCSENINAVNHSGLIEQPSSSSILFGQPSPRIPDSASGIQKVFHEINIYVSVYILHP
jgi:hypothetical protein